jgi:hypothetical protein
MQNKLGIDQKSGGNAAGGADGWGTVLQRGGSRFRLKMVSMEIFIDINLLTALWPWVRLKL